MMRFLFLQKELDGFLDYTRMKFVGFKLQEDRTTLAGLPKPIHEGVKILNRWLLHIICDGGRRQKTWDE